MFHLDVEVSCENPPKSRLKRRNSLARCITREIESSRTGPGISLKSARTGTYIKDLRQLIFPSSGLPLKRPFINPKDDKLGRSSGRRFPPHDSISGILSPLRSINTVHILRSRLIEAQRDLQDFSCQRRVLRLKPAVLSGPTHVQLERPPVHRRSGVWV